MSKKLYKRSVSERIQQLQATIYFDEMVRHIRREFKLPENGTRPGSPELISSMQYMRIQLGVSERVDGPPFLNLHAFYKILSEMLKALDLPETARLHIVDYIFFNEFRFIKKEETGYTIHRAGSDDLNALCVVKIYESLSQKQHDQMRKDVRKFIRATKGKIPRHNPLRNLQRSIDWAKIDINIGAPMYTENPRIMFEFLCGIGKHELRKGTEKKLANKIKITLDRDFEKLKESFPEFMFPILH